MYSEDSTNLGTPYWFLKITRMMSTIMLGWHYALDGFGGILVVSVSALAARHVLNVWRYMCTEIGMSIGSSGS